MREFLPETTASLNTDNSSTRTSLNKSGDVSSHERGPTKNNREAIFSEESVVRCGKLEGAHVNFSCQAFGKSCGCEFKRESNSKAECSCRHSKDGCYKASRGASTQESLNHFRTGALNSELFLIQDYIRHFNSGEPTGIRGQPRRTQIAEDNESVSCDRSAVCTPCHKARDTSYGFNSSGGLSENTLMILHTAGTNYSDNVNNAVNNSLRSESVSHGESYDAISEQNGSTRSNQSNMMETTALDDKKGGFTSPDHRLTTTLDLAKSDNLTSLKEKSCIFSSEFQEINDDQNGFYHNDLSDKLFVSGIDCISAGRKDSQRDDHSNQRRTVSSKSSKPLRQRETTAHMCAQHFTNCVSPDRSEFTLQNCQRDSLDHKADTCMTMLPSSRETSSNNQTKVLTGGLPDPEVVNTTKFRDGKTSLEPPDLNGQSCKAFLGDYSKKSSPSPKSSSTVIPIPTHSINFPVTKAGDPENPLESHDIDSQPNKALLGDSSKSTSTPLTTSSIVTRIPTHGLTFPLHSEARGAPRCYMVVPLFRLKEKLTRRQLIQLAVMMGLGFICVAVILLWVFSPMLF